MSSIGPINIAGAFAGAQKTDAASTERKQADSAEQSRKIDQQQLSDQILDDVGASDHSADRDADGRDVMEGSPGESDSQPNTTRQTPASNARAQDAEGQRGLSLDLDA